MISLIFDTNSSFERLQHNAEKREVSSYFFYSITWKERINLVIIVTSSNKETGWFTIYFVKNLSKLNEVENELSLTNNGISSPIMKKILNKL